MCVMAAFAFVNFDGWAVSLEWNQMIVSASAFYCFFCSSALDSLDRSVR